MASEMKIWIKAKSKEELNKVLDEIHALGIVEEKFSLKSCNFEPYDNECCDEASGILDELNIEYEMI